MATYELNPKVVRRCIDELDSLKIHPHFAAYLGLTRLAEQQGTKDRLQYDYEAYYDQFFKVTMDGERNMTIDGSEKEYLVPFTNPHARNIWRSDNQPQQVSPGTAGRSTANVGLNNVVDIDIDAATYTLLDNHWELARDHLTYEEKIPAVLVAVFMYRDYGLEADEKPEPDDLVELFREEFGFEDDERFNHLFIEDYNLGSTEVFLEQDD
ncbi:hypothetical protein G3I44_14550 [Halogeometricum borinquense]|uniref:Uncharacterized protein n=1 Tax=Halogeometricum borinquense TaxID=60847 RepID=A0A6C0UJL4_9EURY|nr:hypothetical protein [Halogeometricum borinquense]QIB75407.1 hypothetical protein G3I44_14550 [Halogeometricum borinquense]